jgi:hypothetical protein
VSSARLRNLVIADLRSKMFEEKPIYIIGFVIRDDADEPDFYALVRGDTDCPLIVDERIVFATSLQTVKHAAALGGRDWQLGSLPVEPCLVVDVADALYKIESEDQDNTASILNVLNTSLDFAHIFRKDFPPGLKGMLNGFADHLTFHTDLTSFFGQDRERRLAMIDAFLWLLGLILSHSRLLGPNGGEAKSGPNSK